MRKINAIPAPKVQVWHYKKKYTNTVIFAILFIIITIKFITKTKKSHFAQKNYSCSQDVTILSHSQISHIVVTYKSQGCD